MIQKYKKQSSPSVITAEEYLLIEKKLNDSKNGFRGYVELLNFVATEFKKTIKYDSLRKYSMRCLGSRSNNLDPILSRQYSMSLRLSR
ncbi:hypothetical protein [Ferruginibacter sp.]|uniref:hypothetical protein n=1 Tax=Ferruginibacter sp. TaxID=1940288 RepID=UPI00265995FA|nr:hypothetical protein [Ferruginibacter sp.]